MPRIVSRALLPIALALTLATCLDPCATCPTTDTGMSPFMPIQSSMQHGRFDHTASALSDGKVFIAGGAANVVINASAELYNPSAGAGTFTALANTMNQSRVFHTATLLPNGEVLLAGGESGTVLASAELYNPLNMTFTFTSMPMIAARTAHTATLLQDGMVLIAGGSPNLTPEFLLDEEALQSAELYDPLANSFALTPGTMVDSRSEHTATLLGDGSVLLAGGMDDKGKALASAEIYNVGSGTFTLTTGTMTAARHHHAAALISNCPLCAAQGQVLITGGQDGAGQPLATAELYDPATGNFTPTGKMMKARFFHTATAFNDGTGNVLIAGGDDNKVSSSSAEIYLAASGTFKLLSNSTENQNPTGAGNAAAMLPNDQVLVTGGGLPPDPKEGFFTSNNTAISFQSDRSFTPANPMKTPRVGHTATTLNDGTLLVAGGETPMIGSVLSSTELFDPLTSNFSPGPSLSVARYKHTATSVNNGAQFLIAGGIDSDGNTTDTAELYNVSSNSISSLPNMQMARAGATASLIEGCNCPADGMVFIAGGIANSGATTTLSPPGMKSTEIYDPATETFTLAGNMMEARAFHSAAVLGNGKVLLVGGFNQNGQVQKTAEIYDPSQPVAQSFSLTSMPPHFFYKKVPAIALGDGTVLLNDGIGDAELYQPMSPSFVTTNGGPIFFPALLSPAIQLVNPHNDVLFTGGFTSSGKGAAAEREAQIYDPTTGKFSAIGPLLEARGAHTMTLISGCSCPADGAVLITGGEANRGIATLSSAELLLPGAQPTPSVARGPSE